MLYIMRHGRTDWNDRHKLQGRTDIPLNAEGRRMAENAAEEYRSVPLDVCWCSPLIRARETAEILFPEVEQIVIPNLREMDFGDFEGRGWWEMEQDAAYRAWVDGGCTGRCPNGEDRTVFSQRVIKAVEALLEMEEDLVIVAHGGTQMAALERWGKPERAYYRWQTKCGCGWELDWDGGSLHVERELSFLR